MKHHWLLLVSLLCAPLLSGCSKPAKLTEPAVRQFIDDADQAFLDGRGHKICSARAPDFKLEVTDYSLANNRVLSGWDEAQEFIDRFEDTGEALAGKTITMNIREYCSMVFDNKDYFKGATQERSDLKIEINPDGRHATVHAHYSVKQPIYDDPANTASGPDYEERQIGTVQSESDDESVVALNEDDELKFISTKAVSFTFRVAKARDQRL
jgi:hypothetical protein